MRSKQRTFHTIFWAALIAVAVTLLLVWLFGDGCPRSSKTKDVVTIRDTVRIKELISDTVLRWYEKIVWKEAKPETVWLSPETVAVDTIWGKWPEAIVSLSKKKDRLTFASIVPTDSILTRAVVKGYSYRVGSDFEIRAKGDGFFVKTKHGFWRKFYGGLGGGSGFRVWDDSTMPFVDPYVRAYVGWGPVNVGARLTLHGIAATAEAAWRF